MVTVVRVHFSIACCVRVWVSLTAQWLNAMCPLVFSLFSHCYVLRLPTRTSIKIRFVTERSVCSFRVSYFLVSSVSQVEVCVINDQRMVPVVRAHFSIACYEPVWIFITAHFQFDAFAFAPPNPLCLNTPCG